MDQIKLETELKKQRWTVTAFAKELGVDRRTIYNYLEGNTKPSGEMLEKIAKILGISKKQATKIF